MSNFYKIKYLGGHPDMSKPCDVDIDVSKRNNSLKMSGGGIFSYKEIEIPIDKIVHIGFEEKKKRSAGKTAAGAVVGGILTGGIGLLAGAAIGGKRRDDSNLYITIEHNNREFDVILKPGKSSQKLYSEIVSCFS